MTFRLQHRHTFEPLSITHTLSLRAPRLSTPKQWDWVWPLQTVSANNDAHAESNSKSTSDTLSTLSPVRHVWMSAIRAIAVSDDASFIAFVSHHGAIAVARLSTGHPPASLVPPPYLPPPAAHDWCSTATSVAFFEIGSSSSEPSKARTILSVGYNSGVVAFYDPSSAVLIAITKVHETHPVRRLRFYTALHYPAVDEHITYPQPSTNSALFALLGFNGMVARITSEEISTMLARPLPVVEPYGAGWVLWNLSAQPAVFDIVVCGSAPSPIFEFDDQSQTAPLRVVVAGVSPPLAIFSATSDRTFSARAAAKRAATSVLSAARGFIFSRLSTVPEHTNYDEPRTSVTAVARHVASWTDQRTPTFPLPKLTDVPNPARAITAGLTRGFASTSSQPVASDVSVVLKRVYTPRRAGSDVVRSSQPVHKANGTQRNTVRSASVATIDYDTRRRQSVFASDHLVVNLPRPAKNTRIVERVMAAPPPHSLIATCDSLGRIFIQDPRDCCVLRVLKGYREADVAWTLDDGPVLAILSPRLDILEIHGPLEQKRREAFRVLPGSVLVQSTDYNVFCVFPDGRLFRVSRGKKEDNGSKSAQMMQIDPQNELKWGPESDSESFDSAIETASRPLENARNGDDERASKYELTGAFVGAVKNGRASQAVECLQKVENDSFLVAHLMATLVACTTNVRADVHVALSSKAGDIASHLKNPDLVCRFEAHRRLAEAFGLVAVDENALSMVTDQMRIAKYGPRLMEDHLGAGLTEFGVEEITNNYGSSRIARVRISESKEQIATCEQFILSHYLVPTVDLSTEGEYQIRPRGDLSEEEQIWLAKAYFMKLLELDYVNVPTAGREHPSTADVFLALGEYIGLDEIEIMKHFVLFFLYMPLIPLLNTHVSTYASPLRCAVARIQSRFNHDVVDQILIDMCENTERVANAVLLMRLYRAHDRCESETWSYDDSLRRLDEVLIYKRLVAGSDVPRDVAEAFTARESSGTAGDAEMHAVTAFIASDEYHRARKVLNGGPHSIRRLEELSTTAAASVSEAVLHACRRKVADLIDETSETFLPKNVVSWIREARDRPDDPDLLFDNESITAIFCEIHAILLAAHTFIPDSAVDAVRCLQLAEAMSALIELRKGAASEVDDNAGQETRGHLENTENMELLNDNSDRERVNNRKGVFDDIGDDLDEEEGPGWEVDSVEFVKDDPKIDNDRNTKVENGTGKVNR